MKTIIAIAALVVCSTGCIPYDNCPGQTDCYPNGGYGSVDYCCPAADYCVTAVSPPVCIGSYEKTPAVPASK